MKGGKRVMVFGVFDGCDEGHQYFLNEAAKLGDELIVVVARDDVVATLKNKSTFHTLQERIQAIQSLGVATLVACGDAEQNKWDVIRKYRPEIIAIGHDQEALAHVLRKQFDIKICTIDKYADD